MNPPAVRRADPRRDAQGLWLALIEEIQLLDGKLRNPSFTDYLLPTILDMPPMRVDVVELTDPHGPYGLHGVGEPPTISVDACHRRGDPTSHGHRPDPSPRPPQAPHRHS
jgi:hypothetical protein